jgi:hypothetical protein
VIAPLALLIALASPSPAPSPLVAIPPSWRSEPAPKMHGRPALGYWTNGVSNGESITVARAPGFNPDLHALERSQGIALHRVSPGLTLASSRSLRLCRGTAGWETTYSDSEGGGVTIVYAVTAAYEYALAYRYPGYPGQSAEGKAAAESLCAPADPVFHLGIPPIAAPSGWTRQDRERTWTWFAAPNDRTAQTLEAGVFPHPKGLVLSSGFIGAMAMRYERVHVLQRAPIVLCNGHDGVYVILHAAAKTGPVGIESVIFATKSNVYFAAYSYELSRGARPDAERAIKSLCPERTS